MTPEGPMGCHPCRVHLDAWGEGDRTRPLEAPVRAHLAGCPECRAYLTVHALPARALRAAGPTEVPEGLADRAFLAAMARPVPSFLERFVPVAARTALAATAVALLLWGGVAALGAVASSTATVAPSDPLEVAVALATGSNNGP